MKKKINNVTASTDVDWTIKKIVPPIVEPLKIDLYKWTDCSKRISINFYFKISEVLFQKIHS